MSKPVSVIFLRAEGVAPEVLRPAAELLGKFGVPHREIALNEDQVLPDVSRKVPGGVGVMIVASADTRLPAELSAGGVPVIRVPVEGTQPAVSGLSLLTAGNTESGEGFATVALGHAGAVNAALLAVAILSARGDERLREAWSAYRKAQTETVLGQTLPAP